MWPKLNTMKHFVTLVACLASFIALAQNPNYDPDSNGDDLIGAEDLVSLLSVYNTSLSVDTALECDFDGTVEDEWLFGVLNGEVIIDSIVVQYSISDSTTYFEPGCPVEQVYYLDVEVEYALFFAYDNGGSIAFTSDYIPNWGVSYGATFSFWFNSENGQGACYWFDQNLFQLRYNVPPYDSEFHFPIQTSAMYSCENSDLSTPTFQLGENGLVGGVTCSGSEFSWDPFNSPFYNYFRILPYWHYAE